MIRRASQYVIDRCNEEDSKIEAAIKARGDDKEIEQWFNQPRNHDVRLLTEAKQLVEDEFVTPIFDEIKRRKALNMFKQIFKNLDTFKLELKALSSKKTLNTREVRKHFRPETVSIETYMYALDNKATIDMAVSDMVGSNSELNQLIAHERQ